MRYKSGKFSGKVSAFKGVKEEDFMKSEKWRNAFGFRNMTKCWGEIQGLLNPPKKSKQEAKIEAKKDIKQGAK